MQGVINVLKPPGMTSHDVVAFIRRALGIRRVGHTGTLDPAAAGVLVVCVGAATRLVEYLQVGSKEYVAEATFGYETDTLDAVGRIAREADASRITAEALKAALPAFCGDIEQLPPLYSAIKQDGRKLYDEARRGDIDETALVARKVTISRLELTRFENVAQSTLPRAMLKIECSGGTYIRSLVRDLGLALNSAATMTFLVRSRNGHFSINDARTIEAIAQSPAAALTPMTEILPLCAPLTVVDNEAVMALSQGRVAPAPDDEETRILIWNEARTLAALAIRNAGFCRAEKVFNLSSNP